MVEFPAEFHSSDFAGTRENVQQASKNL